MADFTSVDLLVAIMLCVIAAAGIAHSLNQAGRHF